MIITHPDNLEWLAKRCERAQQSPVRLGRQPFPSSVFDSLGSVEIRTDPNLPIDKPTGRLIGPDGVPRDRSGFRCRWDRFTILDESDLAWAVPLGLVTEERERLFYEMLAGR